MFIYKYIKKIKKPMYYGFSTFFVEKDLVDYLAFLAENLIMVP